MSIDSNGGRQFDEQRIRTRGTWMIVAGGAVTSLTFVIALVWYAGFHEHTPTTLVLPLYGVGFAALSLGCMERLGRRTRANHDAALTRLENLESGMLMLVDLMPDTLKQQWFAGYGQAARDMTGLRTGTDGRQTHVPGDAEIVDIRTGRPER